MGMSTKTTMAEKRKSKKNQEVAPPIEEKPTKQEYEIAKYMRKNVPTKKTKFLNHPVNFFYANKAIDVLMDSPWATGKDILFTTRESIVDYMNKMLKLKFFHRARKVTITDRDLRPKDLKKKKEKEKEDKKKENEKKSKKTKTKEETEDEETKGEDEEEVTKNDEEDSKKEEEDSKKEEEEKKKKRKIRLDMHLEQVFVDGPDAYVWMYEPVPFWYYLAGAGVLLCCIAVCLFPLWPPQFRKGVYYLSVAAAGFLGLILGLAVLRFVVFVLIWLATFGYHHLWLLPNLTEDVGFFASFWPLYQYEYRGPGYDKKKKKKKAVKDTEEEEKVEEEGADTDKPETDVERLHSDAAKSGTEESDNSENSNSQAFEIINKDEVDNKNEENTDGEEQDINEEEKES